MFSIVDGIWKSWQEWSHCDVSCGLGTQYRNRTCNGPYNGGKNCTGEDEESQECFPKECPGTSILSHFLGHSSELSDRMCVNMYRVNSQWMDYLLSGQRGQIVPFHVVVLGETGVEVVLVLSSVARPVKVRGMKLRFAAACHAQVNAQSISN